MDWFRSYHGAPTDPKWLAIGKRSETLPGVAACFWWALTDYASQQEDRGSVAGFDIEAFAAFSGFDEKHLCNAFRAFQDKEMIVDQRLKNWEKRQPKREDNSTERVRRHRDARKRMVTRGNSRGEEIRVEKNISPSLRSGDPRSALSPAEQEVFELWWKAWPNKVGKAPAAKAFKTALTKASAAELTAAALRYADLLARPGAPLPKHPQGWLNDERWKDEIDARGPQQRAGAPVKRTESGDRAAILEGLGLAQGMAAPRDPAGGADGGPATVDLGPGEFARAG